MTALLGALLMAALQDGKRWVGSNHSCLGMDPKHSRLYSPVVRLRCVSVQYTHLRDQKSESLTGMGMGGITLLGSRVIRGVS